MKGITFSMDALFALLIIAALVPVLLIVSFERPEEEIFSLLQMNAEDSINTISNLRIKDVRNEKVIDNLFTRSILTDADLNFTLLEIIGALWASDNSTLIEAANNISKNIIDPIIPDTVKWRLTIDNEIIYNTTENINRTLTLSKRVLSGVAKGKPSTGFLSNAFIVGIEKLSSSYVFFGGFVGQGNISVNFSDIPSDANILSIYMEMDVGSNFSLYINNNKCGTFNKTLNWNNWTIVDQNCLNKIIPGINNTFKITFLDSNFAKHFIGGGFIKITYNTEQFSSLDINSTRKYLPEITGITNYFDSFYVPGSLSNMTIYLHYVNNINATLFFNVAGKEIFRNSDAGEKNTILNDTYLKGLLSYANLSNQTVPIRLGTEGFAIGGGVGASDSILITDNSGSMSTCDVNVSCSAPAICDTTPPCNDERIDVAKQSDKEFVDTILLNYTGNRIGLVAYKGSACNVYNLTDNVTVLKNTINNYTNNCVGVGGTCVSCGE